MPQLTRFSSRVAFALLACSLLLFACGDDSPPGDFISDVYGHSTGESDFDAPGADAGAAAPDEEDAGAERAIAEADIIQVDGDRLFALSRYAGMTIVDLSNPSDLRVLGQHRFSAEPFEMYLRDDVAYVLYNGYWTFERDDETGEGSWQTTARIQALDVADPSRIELLADHELYGRVSDSRMVGDIVQPSSRSRSHSRALRRLRSNG